jgi:FAD/FMN-containing dehydrogenase
VARRAASDTLEGPIYARMPALVEAHRGAIAQGYQPYWRRAGGYRLDRLSGDSPFNLARFVVGSEGTLVIVTEATVRLIPLPRAKAIEVGHFASVADAIDATEDALSTRPGAVELIDRTILELSRRKIEYAALGSILEGDPGALLFVTFDGESEVEASAGVERLAELWQRHHHGYHTLRATMPEQQAALLKVRSAGWGCSWLPARACAGGWPSSRTRLSIPPAYPNTCSVSALYSSATALWPGSTIIARLGACISVRTWISRSPRKWPPCAP